VSSTNEQPAVDLTNCDREPIHELGAVQPFGFLLAVSSDWLVHRASANLAEFVRVEAQDALGMPLIELFGEEVVHLLRNRLTLLRGTDAIERVFGVHVGDHCFDFALHVVGASVVIEGEQCSAAPDTDAASVIRAMTARLDEAADMTAFFREGARQIRALTGFDRVMVYRFDRDGSGSVVAEAARAGIGNFLGLRYPASDIPKQARALYVRNPFRIIGDVAAAPVPVVPQLNERGEPLDLSLSVLRAVSPIHIEYLKNMGVGASLSISIIVDGQLWGLFACHHYSARVPTFERRSIAELFGQMFAFKLESRERRELAAYETAARSTSDRLLSAIAGDAGMLNNVEWLGDTLKQTVPCDGVAIWMDGRVGSSGMVPPPEALPQITRRLNAMAAGRVYATDHLSEVLPSAEAYSSVAAGLLAIPISRSPRDYVLLFRQEKIRTVQWAGDPHKPASYGPNGARLTPRESFEAWSQEVRGRSEPFSDAEIRVAETLRASLIEVVLRLSDHAQEERRRAGERQELLIAELNHRVRNILALIRGLVRQSRDPNLDTASYVSLLEGRVEALARAHDQITQQNWSSAPLLGLIETEGSAYLGDKSERLEAEGPPVLLKPQAFTTLALVLHELATNSAKYGALSDSGRVTVRWSVADDGALAIEWRERGGPVVQAPTRQGFGTTIIQRSVPYDLGGKADVEYAATGVVARFEIPERYFEPDATHPARIVAAAPAPGAPRPPQRQVLSGTVLLVEDSLIIAMDAEDILLRLGAERVVTASGVAQALEELRREAFGFAVLDVNLGIETSLPIADALLARGIPYVFATGYGEQFQLPPEHEGVRVIQKPYTIETVARTIGG
jgi:light-regulated signal transduction histidine kinase (bacteriophytochrome)